MKKLFIFSSQDSFKAFLPLLTSILALGKTLSIHVVDADNLETTRKKAWEAAISFQADEIYTDEALTWLGLAHRERVIKLTMTPREVIELFEEEKVF